MSWWDTALEWGKNVWNGLGEEGQSNVWSSVLAGVGSYADAYMDSKNTERTLANNLEAQRQKGLEDRRTLAYTADLKDFYDQTAKQRKRSSLEGYATHSLTKDTMPVATKEIDVPKKPKPEDYHNG